MESANLHFVNSMCTNVETLALAQTVISSYFWSKKGGMQISAYSKHEAKILSILNFLKILRTYW